MRIALIQNSDFGLLHFHGTLVTSLRDKGAEVWVITPPGPSVAKIEALGVHYASLPMARFVAPWRDLVMTVRLFRILRKVRPDVVHTITIKPNTLGVLAASLAGVPRIVSQVPGLGYVFDTRGLLRSELVHVIVKFLYRQAFRKADRVWFLNREDLDHFEREALIESGKGVVIRSSGVNLQEYAPAEVHTAEGLLLRRELDIPPEATVVLMAGRMTWSKGVREYVEAAKQLTQRHPDAVFLLAGPLDPGCPDPVPTEYLKNCEGRQFRWLGFRSDIPRILQIAEIVVLPSYYREGVPRILLEALATGKPIVAADNVGCREVVDSGSNGFLVPPRDSNALAEAIGKLLEDVSLRAAFGQQSRIKAGAFAEDDVTEAVLRELYPQLSASS